MSCQELLSEMFPCIVPPYKEMGSPPLQSHTYKHTHKETLTHIQTHTHRNTHRSRMACRTPYPSLLSNSWKRAGLSPYESLMKLNTLTATSARTRPGTDPLIRCRFWMQIRIQFLAVGRERHHHQHHHNHHHHYHHHDRHYHDHHHYHYGKPPASPS